MIARAGSGWQTVLADLSLILFMVTAAAVSQQPAAAPARPAPAALPALGEPVAQWRAGPDAPALSAWLRSSGGDPRLRLTILAGPDSAAAALALAAGAGRPARVLIEPGASGIAATLTFDQPPALARGLQDGPAKETLR
ncbi:MAG TPA: hypothetical protein VFV30_09590 [Novosphingobium sp.]|nr:hypothetical protein [Novosphingobium sp.]